MFSGVGKTSKEIKYAIEKILLINAESKSEILEIEKISRSMNRSTNIVRLNPNTDAKPNKISTGKKENKFGVQKKFFRVSGLYKKF